MNFHWNCAIITEKSMADINDLLEGVRENIPLAPYTTFKIGGPARYFYAAKTAEEIRQAARVAKELKLPYYVIGRGSNILVSDAGFEGLIIKVQSSKLKMEKFPFEADQPEAGKIIECDSGVPLGKLVNESVNAGLTGLEWMIGIPGTLGGAIYGNAGAFGHTIGETVESVKFINPDNLEEKNLTGKECDFAYRHSAFKEKKYIILSAILKLKKGDRAESEKIIKEYIAKRRGKYPVGPSAGSAFKNPLIKKNQKAFEKLSKRYPETEKFRSMEKIPAGWLIEEYGLLGKKIGGAMISKEHGNFIINTGGAASEDVIILTSLIKEKIRVNFGIQMEEEIQYVGF